MLGDDARRGCPFEICFWPFRFWRSPKRTDQLVARELCHRQHQLLVNLTRHVSTSLCIFVPCVLIADNPLLLPFARTTPVLPDLPP
jgi:hypothetical protein